MVTISAPHPMEHEKLKWNPVTGEWFCTRCGRTSERVTQQQAQVELDQWECRVPEVSKAPGTETMRLRKRTKMILSTERTGCRFIIVQTDAGPEIKLELFQDVPSLKAFSIGFEMLRGITLAQAKALVDAMNERVIGVTVIPK